MTGEIRRRIAEILCLVMSLLFISSAALAEESGIKVLLDGSEISFDQPPVIENGRTLVPMRGIFEALGATVEWDGDTRTITGKKDGDVIIMQIGSGSFTKNGTEIPLDVPPKIISDRTLVPLRAIAESFDADVNWDGEKRIVTIGIMTENPPKTGEEPEAAEEQKNPEPEILPEQDTPFVVPRIEYEYGPFTLTSYYSSGNYWDSVEVESFIISKCEMTSIGEYEVYANVRGVSDDSRPSITMRFYDENDRVLGEARFILSVAANEEFNVLDYTYVEADVINKAVKTEFFSHSGEKAVYGNETPNIDAPENINENEDLEEDIEYDDEMKFSYEDAMNMNRWAHAASEAANQCIENANNAMGADGYMRDMYIEASKNYADTAKENLLKVEEILNNRVDVVREDGKTAAEVCREVIDILDDIIEYNAEDDILGYSSETIKAVQCLAVEKFTVSLLEGIM